MQLCLTQRVSESASIEPYDDLIGTRAAPRKKPMPAGQAAYVATVRRWDIEQMILTSLREQPKTVSQLFRDLNPGIKSQRHAKRKGLNNRLKGITLDGRVIWRHLRSLERRGYISRFKQLKILESSRRITRWTVTYYYIREQILPDRCGVWYPDTLPTTAFVLTNENDLDTCLEFTTWLRDPQGI